MKAFFAILKDSIREARNGWILQIMLILCVLSLIVISCITFKQATVKSEIETQFGWLTKIIKNNPQFKSLDMSIDGYQESNPEKAWESNYQFDLNVKTDNEEEMKKVKSEMGLPGNRYRAQRMMSQSLNYLKNVNVTVIATDNPNHLKYHVTSEGTKALDRESWRHTPSILNIYDFPLFTMSLREGVFLFQNYVIGGFGAWIVLLISVVVTAGFVPNMMQKGTVDLYIAKPIGRAQLLIYKYFGGLTFFFIIISFLIFFTWLIYALRYGFWNPHLLLAIPLMTFYFGIFYAISVLFATLTRSTIATILMVIVAWICIFVIGKANNSVEERLWQIDHPKKLEDLIQVKDGEKPEIDPDQIAGSINPDAPLFLGLLPRPTWPVVKAIHKITPRTYQLDNRLSEVIAQGVLSPSQLEKKQERPQSASWFEVIAVNVVFITLVLCFACWRFQRRDG